MNVRMSKNFTLTFLLSTLILVTAGCNAPFNLFPPEGVDRGEASVARTLTAIANIALVEPTETPTPESEPGLGEVTGMVCYPSEPPIPTLTLYFEDTTTHTVLPFDHSDGSATYQVDLPPGTYTAYAWRTEFALGGSYSQAVPCGLDVSCTDHSLIPFVVTGGGSITGIDICDWYGEEGAVPTPPPGIPELPEETSTPPTPTNTPPPEGVSLNCDGTYQRVRIIDQGASGKTIAVDNWDGNAWVNVWSAASGDPMLRQLMDEAGAYEFDGCQKLVVVPFRNSNPQLWYELGVYVWDGNSMSLAYFNEGYYGEWDKLGDTISFKEASKLGTVNNGPLGPCEWVTLWHVWDGVAFNQSASQIDVVPNCNVTVP